MSNRRYLNNREAAEYMGLSASWLAHARMRGEGPTWIEVPGTRIVRYDAEDIDKWLAGGKVAGGRPLALPVEHSTNRKRGRPTKAETIARRCAA